MADQRFFSLSGPYNLEELALIAQAEIGGAPSDVKTFDDVAPLGDASQNHVSFLDNRKYLSDFSQSNAGACLVHPDLIDRAPVGMALLLTKQPYHGYARIAEHFHPSRTFSPKIHSSAVIDPSAKLASTVSIDSGVAISEHVVIGEGTHVGANTVIDRGVSIGENCIIGPNISLQYCDIGDRVILHSGVCLGQDGFGFALGAEGHLKVPQLGTVRIGDNVEIGANTTIDRGTGPDTIIGAGSKIDNMVQIGHNVQMGLGCIIVSQVGISGSTKIGNFVMIGGQAGIAGHLEIGDGVQIAAKSGVMRDIEPGSKVGGTPAQPMKERFRGVATLERLAKKKKG